MLWRCCRFIFCSIRRCQCRSEEVLKHFIGAGTVPATTHQHRKMIGLMPINGIRNVYDR